ncbi:MAG: crotonase/enoyl-CoA hydratase family protein [Rhizobiaceae bacterium]
MSELTSTFFNVTIVGAVAHLEMNRPDKANGMSPDFWTDLPRLAQALNRNPNIRCVVLSGAGKHFSAGMDLATLSGIQKLMNEEPGRVALALRDLILRLQDSLSSLEKLRVPVIAVTHGATLGGAIDLITACDMVIASADTSFGIEEIHVGMTADVGTLQRLPKLIPTNVVKELAFTGRRFTAEEAKAWGLVNSIHDDQQLALKAAMELAQDIANKSPVAIAGIKQAVIYARDHGVSDSLNQIATWNGGALRPTELTTAITAKMAKQEAVFADLLKDANE